MKEKLYFDLHGFRFSLIGDPNNSSMKYMKDLYYVYHSTKPIDVDVEVILQDFKKPKDWEISLDGKYYINNKSVFFEQSHKFVKWKSLVNFGSNPVRIVTHGNKLFSERFIYRFVFEPVMLYLMAKKGFTFVHSSGIFDEKNNVSYMFPACSHTGKTSISLYLTNKGYGLLGDDYTILKGSEIYSYATTVRLMDYNFQSCPFLKKKLTLKERIELEIKSGIYKLSMGWAQLPIDVDVHKLTDYIQDKSKIGGIFILTKTNKKKIRIRKIPKRTAVRKMFIINSYELKSMEKAIESLSYDNSMDNFWELVHKNIKPLKTKYYEILIPNNIKSEHIEKIDNFIKHNLSD